LSLKGRRESRRGKIAKLRLDGTSFADFDGARSAAQRSLVRVEQIDPD